jgi:hypothetical protein
MKTKKLWLGMLILVLAFGMTVIGCEEDENGNETTNPDDDENGNGNETTDPIVINAQVNGTLFSSVGTYADKTPFTHEGKQYWVVTHLSYNWEDADSEWDAVKSHNGTPQEHTRVALQIPQTARNYDNVAITYDMIFIGGDNTRILMRNSSGGVDGSDANLQPPTITLEEGTGKIFSMPVSAFYNNPAANAEDGWIAFSKDASASSGSEGENSAGAMLVRITSVKFTKGN